WKTFFENGQLQKVIHYKKGNADGLSKRYFAK
ncbi:MAG TPA: toxin-antitoxin system YwqK family antitoxin, partial [Flavobacteriaceae bacterium]|nr:toxin-antitoxin system YwqK family antitoxin [Flavobacteriaceae bacterium]